MKNLLNFKATVFVFAILAVASTSLNSLHAGVILNLAGIVGGGNGIGNGTAGAGINMLNGSSVAPLAGFINAPTNTFVASSNPFVDGVFVPDGGTGSASIQVSSTGIMVTGISDNSQSSGGSTWDHFRNGNNNGVLNSFSGSSVIGAHASKGITFDLNAMETFHSGQASSYNITAGTGLAAAATADFYLFVDGVLKNSVSLNGATQSSIFSGTLSSSDRFLTLITSPRGNILSDHSLWVNPTVTLSSVTAVPEPSSAVIMLIGAATFALRFRRKR